MKTVALVGMPGAGKSSVGRHLARRLSVSFIDSDEVVERRLREPIRSYFEREGESRFRDVESDVIGDLLGHVMPGVLATGGGAVLRPINRRLLREHAVVVYLHCKPEELHRRLRRDTQRPLLQVSDPRAALRALYAERDPLYRETANYVIETGRPTVQALVGMVSMQLELAGFVNETPGAASPDPTAKPQDAARGAG